MNSDKIIEMLSDETSLTPHQVIDIENAIECGAIDTCDIFDCFKLWCAENESFSEEDVDDYQENFQNLLTFKQNVKLLAESLYNTKN